jgi:hypothetical protein
MVFYNISWSCFCTEYIISNTLFRSTCSKFYFHFSRLDFLFNFYFIILFYLGLCLYFHIAEQWIYSWQNILSMFIAIFYVAIGVFITFLTLVQSLMTDISSNDNTSSSTC